MEPDGDLTVRRMYYDATTTGMPIWSPKWGKKEDKDTQLVLQMDGQLDLVEQPNGNRLWSDWGTSPPPGGDVKLIIGDDGNLVLYVVEQSGKRTARFASNSVVCFLEIGLCFRGLTFDGSSQQYYRRE